MNQINTIDSVKHLKPGTKIHFRSKDWVVVTVNKSSISMNNLDPDDPYRDICFIGDWEPKFLESSFTIIDAA